MLDKITRGKVESAQRVLIYGLPGVGKSTFAAGSPEPVFICSDSGTEQLDIARFPMPESWSDVVKCVKEYASVAHDYKTLVFDTVGWLEHLAYAHVCNANGWSDIEQPGYGRGYAAALHLWLVLLKDIERAWLRGSNIIFVAHSVIKPYNNPEGDNYDRHTPMMRDKLSDKLQSWVDSVFFATYDITVSKDHKAMMRGGRVIRTTFTPAYDAKNRYGFPDTMPLAWVDPTPVEPQIEALLEAHPIHAPKVRQLMRGADYNAMREILAKLKSKCNSVEVSK